MNRPMDESLNEPMNERMNQATSGHPVAQLPSLIAGRLDAAEATEIRRHLSSCDACRQELAAWAEIASAVKAHASEAAPAAGLDVRRVVDRIAREARDHDAAKLSFPRRLAWLRAFVLAQIPIVRREIWPATAIVMALGAAISLLSVRGSVPGAALSLFAPLAAAIGIALIYGADNDPALEIAVAAPTSPRLVVVARLVVVLAWDVALALAASVVLVVADGPAVFVPLVSLWLGPMLLLAALTLLLSLVVGSSISIAIAAVIWTLRALQITGEAELHQFATIAASFDAVWQTTPLTLLAAAVLLLVAVAVTPVRDTLTANPAS